MKNLVFWLTFLLPLLSPPLSGAWADGVPIKLGATISMSGKLAVSGVAQSRGLQLAIDEVNESGGIRGRKLQLVIEDNAGDPKTALSGVSKLFDHDKIDILFSAFSHITQAVKERAKKSNKVMIYAASLGEIAASHELFFRDWGDAASEGRTLAEAIKKDGHKRVALISEINDACAAVEAAFTTRAAELGIEIRARELYTPGETDFKPTLLKLSAKKPDAFACCMWRDAHLVMPQLKNIGLISIPTYHLLAPLIEANDTPELRQLYTENRSRSVWMGFAEGSLDESQKEFFRKYTARFGEKPRMESALAYDDVKIIAAALVPCVTEATVDQSCLAKNMSSTNQSGVSGPLRFDDQRRLNREDLTIEVRNGTWTKVG